VATRVSEAKLREVGGWIASTQASTRTTAIAAAKRINLAQCGERIKHGEVSIFNWNWDLVSIYQVAK